MGVRATAMMRTTMFCRAVHASKRSQMNFFSIGLSNRSILIHFFETIVPSQKIDTSVFSFNAFIPPYLGKFCLGKFPKLELLLILITDSLVFENNVD